MSFWCVILHCQKDIYTHPHDYSSHIIKKKIKIITSVTFQQRILPSSAGEGNVGRQVQRTLMSNIKRVCAFLGNKTTGNCRPMGLSDHKRSEDLQLLSPQVFTGLGIRANGSNHCRVLVLDSTYTGPRKEREE